MLVTVHKAKKDLETQNVYTNLFVSNLGANTTKEDLQKLFENFGEIVSTYVPEQDSKSEAFYGFVNFKDPASAVAAENELNLKHILPNGKIISVNKHVSRQ